MNFIKFKSNKIWYSINRESDKKRSPLIIFWPLKNLPKKDVDSLLSLAAERAAANFYKKTDGAIGWPVKVFIYPDEESKPIAVYSVDMSTKNFFTVSEVFH